MSDVTPRLRRPYRWAVLLAYLPVIGLSQLLWLNFADLQGFVQKQYGVSEFLASTLILVFPLLYVFLSVPAGNLIDRRGYRFAIGGGAVVMAISSLIRLGDVSFWALLAGQTGIALAQPYIVNGVSKLVMDWFDAEEGALATGLATMGMFIGMAAGMATSAALPKAIGLHATMGIFGLISVAAAILFLVVVRPNGAATAPGSAEPSGGLLQLLGNGQLRLLTILIFLGMGEFNGLATFLEQILGAHQVSPSDAGNVGAVLVGGGIVGAVVIPGLSGWLGRRKPFLLLAVGVALLTLYPLCEASDLKTLYVLSAVHGFFFLPAVALMLDLAAQIAGPALAGASASLLMLAGNAGGVVIILAGQALLDPDATARGVVILLIASLAIASALGLSLTETRPVPAVEPA